MTIFDFDREMTKEKGTLLCGVDEAGRGPLAGPVYAAAVVLPAGYQLQGLNDSKKLSAKKRDQLYDCIIKDALYYGIASIDEHRIDEINILNATMEAMCKALSQLLVKPDYILIDGNKVPDGLENAEAIIEGDAKSACIAAASILAKVSRDRYMEELSNKFPMYQFSKHKGYGTKLHYECIKQFGISTVHRKSFLKNLGSK
jgi:ribonuclease HII